LPMWAFYVVESAPDPPILSVKGEQLVIVQTLCPETSVEGFHEGVGGRLARPANVQCDVVDVGHRSRSREMNSEPWSTRMDFG
jgi:hypothetical protein